MSDATKLVQCDQHSEPPATFVCRHLRLGVSCGFHCSLDDSSDPWPDAWCDRCEAAFQREGEWNDSNEPELSLLCTGCYETARSRNAELPVPLRPGQLALTAAEFTELARQACERCKIRQDKARRLWPKFSSAKRWDYQPEERMIRFFDHPSETAVSADVTIAGSFSRHTNTWSWAWGNNTYSESERERVVPLRVFGEVRGIEKFQTANWAAEEIDAWEVTQIAADLLTVDAIYRAPMDHLLVFMLLSNFRSGHPS
jgi:hypothetical protein